MLVFLKRQISHENGWYPQPQIDDHPCAVDAAKAAIRFLVESFTKESFNNSLQVFESKVDISAVAAVGYEGTVTFNVVVSHGTDQKFVVRIKLEEQCRVTLIEKAG